jgi:hypothetical protein
MTRRAHIALILALPWACARAPQAVANARSEPASPPSAVAANGRCEACHADEASEWRVSLHHAAHDDPSYLASFAREPKAFCTGCHAPEGTAPEVASLGVSCTTCHASAHAPGAAALAIGDTCASCHEFSFPDRATSSRPADRMQLTETEHAASELAASTCTDCHMPRVEGASHPHRDHRFAASRDPDALRRAVGVAARLVDGDVVEVTLRPGRTGHAFPTGDLFRRLVVGVELLNAEGERVDFGMQTLGRTFEARGSQQTQIADTRPGAPGQPEARLRFPLPGAGHGKVRFWVDYQRVQGAHGEAFEVDESTRVFEGMIGGGPR